MADHQGIRDLFTGATLRRIMNLGHHLCDVVVAIAQNVDHGSWYKIDDQKRDVYVNFVDLISNIGGIGRLFSPGGVFWRLPKQGDSIMVLKPSDADGPGVPYVLHGDGGSSNSVPAWLDESNAGIALPETFHLESDKAVIIKSNASSSPTATIIINSDASISIIAGSGQNVTVNGGSLSVARQSDPISSATAGPYAVTPQVIQSGAPFFKA